MKRGFTLVEMLIVVVVLVTLMSITFRLGAINGASALRNRTVDRIQKLENCLSGYYAAFGSYPPVQTVGYRNPYLRVSSHGIQNSDGEENREIFNWDADRFRRGVSQSAEAEAWDQVEAACAAQPLAARFPFAKDYGDVVKAYSDQLKEEVNNNSTASKSLSEDRKKVFTSGFDDGVAANRGRFSSYRNKSSWSELQMFQFGLMSFLLPRYLVMMHSYEELYEDYAQWTGNNILPSNPITGQKFTSWEQVSERATSQQNADLMEVANIPSQAVTARWMANLEKIVHTGRTVDSLFGVDINDPYNGACSFNAISVYSPGGYDEDATGDQYALDWCTVRDGWQNEFFYYSPPPYQNYVLWSAGPNGRTFPPWISRDELDSKANKCVGAWIEDDIRSMSH